MAIAATKMARAQRMILTRSSPRCSVSVIVSSGDLIDGRLDRRRKEGLISRCDRRRARPRPRRRSTCG